MLLNEEKNGNSHICYFDSSNILACKYDRELQQLAIIFKGGTQYLYLNIVPYIFQRFKVANSQGKEFNEIIKNKYPTVKSEVVVKTDNLLKTIES